MFSSMRGKRSFLLYALCVCIPLLVNGCATVEPPRPVTSGPIRFEGVYHVVLTGETLWRIAKVYHVDMGEIMRANRINDPTQIGLGQRLFIPRARCVVPPTPGIRAQRFGDIEKIVGPRHPLSQWRTITLHHSATIEGSAASFDRNHRQRHMGGLFYHFVIGNGAGSGDGEIEVGWRWRRQAQVERPRDIQICLVGDFCRQDVTEAQFNALLGLVSVLCEQYNIPVGAIRRHKDIRGKRTACPGGRFPLGRLKETLARGSAPL